MIGTLAVDGGGGAVTFDTAGGTGRGRSPLRSLIAVPNVTARPSTASVPTYIIGCTTIIAFGV